MMAIQRHKDSEKTFYFSALALALNIRRAVKSGEHENEKKEFCGRIFGPSESNLNS